MSEARTRQYFFNRGSCYDWKNSKFFHQGWNLVLYSCGHLQCPTPSMPHSHHCPSSSSTAASACVQCSNPALPFDACILYCGACVALQWCFSRVPGTALATILHGKQSAPVAFLQAEEHRSTTLKENRNAACFWQKFACLKLLIANSCTEGENVQVFQYLIWILYVYKHHTKLYTEWIKCGHG